MKKAVNGLPDKREQPEQKLGSLWECAVRRQPGRSQGHRCSEADVSTPQRFQGSAKNLGFDL